MATEKDAWDTKDMQSNEKAWSERNPAEKALFVLIQFLKVVLTLALLYIFLISLSLMGGAFKILGGPTAGAVFRNNEIFSNPFAGCSLGILATVLVQSSSTSTSIIISMTAAGLMTPQNAIYMIMGANIGTSVTNTIVSVTHAADTDQYRRAFAGATVHDCFNLLTVMLLLPLEYITHLLYHIGSGLVNAFGIEEDQEKQDKVDFIKKIIKPVTARLVQVDKKLVTKVAQESDPSEYEELLATSMLKNKRSTDNNIFLDTPMGDAGAGWLLLVISLVMLSVTLILLVKVLQTIFRGRVAIYMQSFLNLDLKGYPGGRYISDYILIIFGMIITILMQSSSVTTSTLTPLVGIGLIKLEKMLPFTVGANIGTTVTGILSALAGSNIATGMTVALAHLFFNLIGTIVWFPIPAMRNIPLCFAKGLGNLAADLKWFPIAYIIFTFGVVPGTLFALSLAHWAALVFVGLPLLCLLGAGVCIATLRAYKPSYLPASLKKDFKWMPESMKMTFLHRDKSEEVESSSQQGSADTEGANKWWGAPVAQGLTWYAILALLITVPNAKWGDMKYASFDTREHIGLGSWSACSKLFKSDAVWAPEPYAFSSLDLSNHLTQCTQSLRDNCDKDNAFSTQLGANAVYEKSWADCSLSTTQDWEAKCKEFNCGSGHEEQCSNISAAIVRPYDIEYRAEGKAWTKGEPNHVGKDGLVADSAHYCVPMESLCTDVGNITTAGNLGVAGTVFAFAGLFLSIAYSMFISQKDVRKILWLSCLAFGITWILLLASWASFASTLNVDTTCYVQNDHNNGIIAAKGKFGEIMNEGGSYTYGFVIGAWVLVTLATGLSVQRIVSDMRGWTAPKQTPDASKNKEESQTPVPVDVEQI